jgi:hypothetical protein
MAQGQSNSVQFVPTINTVAGNGTAGTWGNQTMWGDGGPGPLGEVSTGMRQVAVDAQGNIYATDTTNQVIRRVDGRTGIITTVAGNGTACSGGTAPNCGDGGLATSAQLNAPRGIAVDSSGNIYIADYNDHRIRMVSATTGYISTIVGKGTTCSPTTGACGDGGQATAALLTNPSAVALDGLGNLYIADTYDHKIRKVVLKTGIISTVAGTGTSGYSGDNAAATLAMLNLPIGLTCDAVGNIYLSDSGTNNYRIRMIQVSTGNISTIAGTGTQGTVVSTNGDGGLATSALMDNPYNLAVDLKGNLYVIDSGYSEVREILATATGASPTFGNIIAFAGGAGAGSSFADGIPPTAAKLTGCNGVAIDSFGNVIIGDTFDARIRRVTVVPPLNTTAVGSTSATATFSTQDQVSDRITGFAMASGFTEFTPMTYAALQAELSGACTGILHSAQVCQETATFTPKYPGLRTGVLNLTDYYSNPVSLGLVGYGLASAIAFTPGTISTVAGNGIAAFSGDGGAATSAALNTPTNAVVDAANNIYMVDAGNHVIRRIDSTGKITTYVGTGGTSGYSGDGSVATGAVLNSPQSVVLDAAGNLYIADTGNNAIRVVLEATGKITTVAGGNGAGYSGDGSAATSAKLASPSGVAIDVIGNLYIADTGNNVVRAVNLATGVISTVAGNGTVGSTGDGAAAASAELNGPVGAFYLPPPAVQVNTLYPYQEAGQLLIADTGNNKIRKVNLTTGIITTAAGTGTAGYTGDGGLATAATLKAATTVVADAAGNLYIADAGNTVIRRINAATGNIVTIAGTGTAGSTGGIGTATALPLNVPAGVALDSSANIYISDKGANILRKIDVSKGAAIAFGNQATSGITSRLLTATNTGNSNLTFTGLSFSSNFSQQATTGTDCSSTTVLATGASCNISVGFAPTGTTTYSGTVTATDNALNVAGTTQATTLSGTGVLVANTLAITPGSFSIAAGMAQSVTITASTSGTTVTTYTGTVRFTSTDGSATLPTAYTFTAADAGVHTFYGLSFVTAGAQTLTATDSGNSLSGAASVTVTGTAGATTTTTLGVSSSTPPFGQSVTLTATVSATGTPTGTMSFQSGSIFLGSATLSNCVASLVTSALPIGINSVTATYAGNTAYTSSTSTPITVTVSAQNLWLVNGNNTLSVLSSSGTAVSGSSGYTGGGAGIAIDSSGNAWSANTTANTLTRVNSTGSSISTFTGGGLNAPVAVAVTGTGYIWIANTNNSLSLFDPTGLAVSPTTGFTGGSLNQPAALAVDSSGNLWVANGGSNSVTMFLGAADPVVTPFASASQNSTQGTRP